MPVRIEPNSEPITGYRLIERLGGGGFGEVWKCEAPGGLFKAIKFVYGELDAVDEEDGSRAEQELKALQRVKTVHHPYILSLERYDIKEGQLMIVMELADRTLWDRFKECRAQGLPGIPRAELLGYMRETAEALDLMNDQFQLQHLDIKPQNLFLVFNHVKVADFGLVKDLGTKAAATITGGVTPVYAAPETFDGWLSRFSDQYSLAIVYQELLTGQRPFGGATMRQLVLQHLQGTPNLSPLPAVDQPIVARALAKEPDGRYPNCLEFVRQLQAVAEISDVEPDAESHRGGAGDGASEIHAAAPYDDAAEPRTFGLRGRLNGAPAADGSAADGARPRMLSGRPDHDLRFAEPSAVSQPDSTIPAVRRPTSGEVEIATVGPVQPAVIIGLGGVGLQALAQLRRRLTAELARPEDLPQLRLLGMDTDPEALRTASTGEPGRTLHTAEVLPTRLHRASHYLKTRDGRAPGDWLNAKLLYRIPRDQNSAGLRPLGRLAFVDNYRHIGRRLEAELRACGEVAARPAAEGLGSRASTPRVYVVLNLAGNTGGGMFLDVAFAVREQLRRLGHGGAEVVGLFAVPADGARPAALANAYAAMTELSHFCRSPFMARYETGERTAGMVVRDGGPPFTRCIVFPLPRLAGADADGRAAVAALAEYLYRDLVTPLGPAVDEQRRRLAGAADPELLLGPPVHTVGMSRLSWPRSAALDRGAARVCRRLVEGWLSKDARPVADAMTAWAAEKWDALGLRPEALIARVHELCEAAVHQPPDKMVTAVTGPLGEALAPRPDRPGAAPALGPAVAAMAELDRLLGVPEECRAAHQPPPPPGLLEDALTQAAAKLADICEQRLAEQVVRLIEDPRFRLAGAEEALRQLGAATERALQSQEVLARELQERAALLYQKAHRLLESPVPASPTTNSGNAWKMSFGRRTPAPAPAGNAAELLELIRQYPKARYHALVLHHVNRLYVGLRGQLSDQLREVGFCRQRLGELVNLFQASAAVADDAAPGARVLLPSGCRSLDDVLTALDRDLTRDELLALDQQVQSLIRQQFRALVNVCMGSSAMVRSLVPAMLAKGREFLAPRFAATSVADLLLERGGADEVARADYASKELHDQFARALPQAMLPRADAQFNLALLPDDARGLELQALVREDLNDAAVVAAARPDEIVFFREQIAYAVAPMEILGRAARDAYQQRLVADAAGLHTREDVGAWQPSPVAAVP